MYIATEGYGEVVVVDFPYIGKNNKDGKPNKTFLLVEDLIRNKKTIKESGLEKAMIVGTHAVLSKNEYLVYSCFGCINNYNSEFNYIHSC